MLNKNEQQADLPALTAANYSRELADYVSLARHHPPTTIADSPSGFYVTARMTDHLRRTLHELDLPLAAQR